MITDHEGNLLDALDSIGSKLVILLYVLKTKPNIHTDLLVLLKFS